MHLLLVQKLKKKYFANEASSYRLISNRQLTFKEVAIAREIGISRYYLPSLNDHEVREFFQEFDKFWDKVIQPFDQEHFFWRNSISSKMQDWERSAGYLSVILFALSCKNTHKSEKLVIICASLEEEEIWEQWASKNGWNITNTDKKYPIIFRRLKQEIGNYVAFGRKCIRCFLRKYYCRTKPVSDVSNLDETTNLIISQFYPQSFEGKTYRDPFFGTLHKNYLNDGHPCVFLSDCLAPINRNIVRKAEECSDAKVFIPYSLLSFFELGRILFSLFTKRIKINPSFFIGVDFSKLLAWNSRRFTHYWNIHSELYYEAIRKICSKNHFHRFVLMYEGNVFERGCIQAIRQLSDSQIIGYSHGVIYRSNLKLRLTDQEKLRKPEPDKIVCTGTHSKAFLADVGNRDNEDLYGGCSLRDIPVAFKNSERQISSKMILIALDGALTTVTVLDWLIEHRKVFEGYNICLRAHPNVPIDKIMDQCLQLMPKCFVISRSTLEEDIKRSLCVVYRHTSIGIQALLNDIPVIHLAIDSPISGDPIQEMHKSKWIVHTLEELKCAIEEIAALVPLKRTTLLNEAKNLVKDYLSSPTKDKLSQFIEV